MKLVEDWKQAYRWYSIHAAAVLAALSMAQAALPQVQAIIPASLFPKISAALALAVIVGRLVAQDGPPAQ